MCVCHVFNKEITYLLTSTITSNYAYDSTIDGPTPCVLHTRRAAHCKLWTLLRTNTYIYNIIRQVAPWHSEHYHCPVWHSIFKRPEFCVVNSYLFILFFFLKYHNSEPWNSRPTDILFVLIMFAEYRPYAFQMLLSLTLLMIGLMLIQCTSMLFYTVCQQTQLFIKTR